MKTYIVYLVIGLVAINSLSAQVKIGDNPQNLNPASLLELQSSNRVLVITRVTDAQMSGISPLPGAVVYNTDQGCLHYYNGTEWINICEELDNSFTVSTRADSLQQVNPNARDNTIAILESINPDGSTNYNFEVNRITGANIVDTSINGRPVDVQWNSMELCKPYGPAEHPVGQYCGERGGWSYRCHSSCKWCWKSSRPVDFGCGRRRNHRF